MDNNLMVNLFDILSLVDGMIDVMVREFNLKRIILNKQPRNPKVRYDFYSLRGSIVALREFQKNLCEAYQIEWQIYDVDLLEKRDEE